MRATLPALLLTATLAACGKSPPPVVVHPAGQVPDRLSDWGVVLADGDYFELNDGVYYGFPAIEPHGVKVGDHAAGKRLSRPEDVDRAIDPAEEQAITRFTAAHLPGLASAASHHATCFYTMSPDEHFVVDRLPSDERVAFAAGLSGHGFKFTPVLGEALADLTLEGRTRLPVEFLSAGRFADP